MSKSAQEIADILTDAADYLWINGWIKGEFGDHKGPRCVLGAIMSVTQSWDQFASYGESFAAGALGAYLDKFPQFWNDNDCTSEEEARDALLMAGKAVASGAIQPMTFEQFAEYEQVKDRYFDGDAA